MRVNCGKKNTLCVQIVISWILLADLCECSFTENELYDNSIKLVNEGFKRQEDIKDSSRKERSVTDSIYIARTNCRSNDTQPPNRVNVTQRVAALRERMKIQNFDVFLVPSEDEHQNEYVAPSDERRRFISGLSGSAGVALVTMNDLVLWTDTRYTIQADQELDCSWKIVIQGSTIPGPVDWIISSSNGTIKHLAADPRLIGAEKWIKMETKLTEASINISNPMNMFEEVWGEFGRPQQANNTIYPHDLVFAGASWENKINDTRKSIKNLGAEAMVVTALDEVAWLLNLRGSDVPFNPVFRSYMILETEKESLVHLFMHNPVGLNENLLDHLRIKNCSQMCIKIHEYSTVIDVMKDLFSKDTINQIILSDKHSYSSGISYYIYSAVPETKRLIKPSPIMLMKSMKNEVQAKAMIEAQYKDAVALIQFFSFLEKEISKGVVYDELSAMDVLQSARSKQKDYRGDSFRAISSYGSHSSIIHYSPSNLTKVPITNESMYLLDSGGQYLGGTTDVTRTFHFGNPTEFQKKTYTLVLKGVIDLASVTFPYNSWDSTLDILARRALLDEGLEYGHGTGHGVGQFSNVHEAPILMSMKQRSTRIKPGQFFTIEPGYYHGGEFGIRLESLVHVINHPTLNDMNGKPFLKLDKVTLVPYESKLIDFSALTNKQCDYMNGYNSRIRTVIGPRLERDSDAFKWMEVRTEPIAC